MSRDCCAALPRGTIGLSAVCDCGISLSYSLTIFIVVNVLTNMIKREKMIKREREKEREREGKREN